MRKMFRKNISLILVVLLITGLLGGCVKNEDKNASCNVYYLNANETAIVPVPYTITSVDIGDQTEELLAMLSIRDEEADYVSAIPENVEIRSFEMGEGNLSIHFSRDYSSLTTTREALLRAAVVKTLTQIEGVDTVSFYILDDPLTDASGNIMAAMSSSSIIDDFGAAQDAMMQTTLALYYANASGDALIREERIVHYNSSIPIEQVIMQYLAMEPLTEGARSVFVSGSKVASITTSDGICYVDMDSSILTQENGISNDVLIYSIVDSLTELDSIAHVRLGISGASTGTTGENGMIGGTYERSLALVLNEAEAENGVDNTVEDIDRE